ncbi:MAG: hypothetical protein M3125_04715, partial [Gemmatimonadota bacterium]|nr:hypothetical protein [Gemmatimonadota bacterium]
MRFRGVSITMVGAATLLLALAPGADAQRGRMGVLRPAPRPCLVGGPLPRRGIVPPRFIGSCVFASPFFPFFVGLPFFGAHLFAGTQPAPDPTS